jgi:hypothetical protein
MSPISSSSTQTLVTQTVIAEGLRQADFAAAKTFGATVIEGNNGEHQGSTLRSLERLAPPLDSLGPDLWLVAIVRKALAGFCQLVRRKQAVPPGIRHDLGLNGAIQPAPFAQGGIAV